MNKTPASVFVASSVSLITSFRRRATGWLPPERFKTSPSGLSRNSLLFCLVPRAGHYFPANLLAFQCMKV